jgi:hypothetical protein
MPSSRNALASCGAEIVLEVVIVLMEAAETRAPASRSGVRIWPPEPYCRWCDHCTWRQPWYASSTLRLVLSVDVLCPSVLIHTQGGSPVTQRLVAQQKEDMVR